MEDYVSTVISLGLISGEKLTGVEKKDPTSILQLIFHWIALTVDLPIKMEILSVVVLDVTIEKEAQYPGTGLCLWRRKMNFRVGVEA